MTMKRFHHIHADLALFVLVLVQAAYHAAAFSDRTGACANGVPSTFGAHADAATVVSGALADFDLRILLDGEPLTPDAPVDFTTGEDHLLFLEAQGSGFRGFVFRLGPGNSDLDTIPALTPLTSDVQLAQGTCIDGQGVGGVSHTNSNVKTSIASTLRIDTAGDPLPLDVTVVIRLRNEVSEFYFNRFLIRPVNPVTPTPTVLQPMPTVAPTVTRAPSPPSPRPTPRPTVPRVPRNRQGMTGGTMMREKMMGEKMMRGRMMDDMTRMMRMDRGISMDISMFKSMRMGMGYYGKVKRTGRMGHMRRSSSNADPRNRRIPP